MHLPFAVTAILLAFIYPVLSHRYSKEQNEDPTACKHSSSVEAFAASFYTALIVTQDPNAVRGLELPGQQAGDKLYSVVADILEDEGLCNADMVAWTASRAVSMVNPLKLTKYFKLSAYSVGELIEDKGLLDCKNAVSLALDFFKFVRKSLKGLDGSKFESYMKGIGQGLVYFLLEHDLELEVIAPESADIFYQVSSNEQRDKCKISQAQN